jgi:hypothetical protein
VKPTVAIRQGARLLPYHNFRERWLVDEWRYYSHSLRSEVLEETLSKADALQLIDKRLQQIAPYVTEGDRSKRAKLFEFLAEQVDEDGVLRRCKTWQACWMNCPMILITEASFVQCIKT